MSKKPLTTLAALTADPQQHIEWFGLGPEELSRYLCEVAKWLQQQKKPLIGADWLQMDAREQICWWTAQRLLECAGKHVTG